jgi:hypothetical protein
MISTTGTTLTEYANWLEQEAERKQFGEVGIYLVIHAGQIVDVRRTSVDTEHFRTTVPVPPPPPSMRVGKKGET